MDATHQFWWNWWIQLAVAIGTIGAVILALFVSLRKPKPQLKLKVLRAEGEPTRLNSGEDVRFYHLHVWNERRSIAATEVQVYLSRLDESGANGKLQKVWQGNVPLRWRDQEFVPTLQKIGSAKDCDLCQIGRQSGLSLMPLFVPNSLNSCRQGKCKLILFLQARSNEADSEVIRIAISWDGIWEDTDNAMKQHFAIEVLADGQT